jgi:hypothetical protein
VKKASESEHEVEAAQRDFFPKPVDHTKRTTKIPKVELETILRTESGTRPIVGPDAISKHTEAKIDRHVRERIEAALLTPPRPPASAGQSAPPPAAIEASTEDPHARPTIDVFRAIPSSLITAEPVASDHAPVQIGSPDPSDGRRFELDVVAPAVVTPAGLAPAFRAPAVTARASPAVLDGFISRRWLIAAAVFSIVVLVATAGTVGFILGRITGHH